MKTSFNFQCYPYLIITHCYLDFRYSFISNMCQDFKFISLGIHFYEKLYLLEPLQLHCCPDMGNYNPSFQEPFTLEKITHWPGWQHMEAIPSGGFRGEAIAQGSKIQGWQIFEKYLKAQQYICLLYTSLQFIETAST